MKILNYVNIKPELHLLFCVWLVTCFVPNIQHPMPIIHGEKGAAKSTACELLKTVIDPSSLSTLNITNKSSDNSGTYITLTKTD
jgi:hypothetical protein